MSSSHEDWDIEISANHNLFDLKLRDVWHYRDLLVLLVRRDFVSFYKQTIFGPLWFFIQPLFTTIIFTFVFGNLAGISTDGIPQPLFYLAGITAWNYFADCLTKTSSVFTANAAIFGKVYFPRLVVPLSIVVSNLIRFAVQLLLFFVMLGYYWVQGTPINITWYIWLFPFIVALMALLGLGMGMIISAMTNKYRDLSFLVTFGVQLMMYITTVVYPLSEVKHKYPKYEWLVAYNPMTPLIEAFRKAFLGSGTVSLPYLGESALIIISLMLLGIVIFNKVERTFIDTV